MFEATDGILDIEVLLIDDVTLLQTSAVVEPLRAANRVLGRPVYRWRLTSPDGRAVHTTGGLPIPIEDAFRPDASRAPLFVVASYNWERSASRDLLHRLSLAGRRRSAVAGLESGCWLMALAGLLDGHRATPHWEDAEAFEARFPEIEVRAEPFLIDGKRITSGGAVPTLDLMLELIRRAQGYPVALQVSRLFIYDPARGETRTPPSLGSLQRRDRRVAEAVALMEARIEEPLGLEALAAEVGLGTRRLRSLFHEVLGVGPQEHYLALRLNRARRLLIETGRPVTDIALATGFSSSGVFARRYRASFGERPLETRRAARVEPSDGASRR